MDFPEGTNIDGRGRSCRACLAYCILRALTIIVLADWWLGSEGGEAGGRPLLLQFCSKYGASIVLKDFSSHGVFSAGT